MGKRTGIAWTTSTFNGWFGCVEVPGSGACSHCYAREFSKRLGMDLWGKDKDRKVMSESYWNKPLSWNKEAQKSGTPWYVFCASMADVFEDRRDLDPWREKLWALIEKTPFLTWQLLTKRIEEAWMMLPSRWHQGGWPKNVWMGTTTEDQCWFRRRLAFLAPFKHMTPCKTFISVEPMLAPVSISSYENHIDWVIVGGESGHRARPMDENWVRSLRDECQAAGVAFFYKQKNENGRIIETPTLDGRQWTEFPNDRKEAGMKRT